jgi:hypothetical protein
MWDTPEMTGLGMCILPPDGSTRPPDYVLTLQREEGVGGQKLDEKMGARKKNNQGRKKARNTKNED